MKKLMVVISNGPNYDKEVLLSNFVGLNVDEAIKFIEENFMNNVTFDFVASNDTERDIVINQNIKGQVKRNSDVVFTDCNSSQKNNLINAKIPSSSLRSSNLNLSTSSASEPSFCCFNHLDNRPSKSSFTSLMQKFIFKESSEECSSPPEFMRIFTGLALATNFIVYYAFKKLDIFFATCFALSATFRTATLAVSAIT